MNLLRYFKEHSLTGFGEVKERLQGHPFHLIVREDGPLYLITYDLVRSNFSSSVVNECRGIILEKNSNAVVCYAFDKFWNHGHKYASEIDWKTSRVTEKLGIVDLSPYLNLRLILCTQWKDELQML